MAKIKMTVEVDATKAAYIAALLDMFELEASREVDPIILPENTTLLALDQLVFEIAFFVHDNEIDLTATYTEFLQTDEMWNIYGGDNRATKSRADNG